jgi:RNA polymerase sigma factor (sigma-70 family)
VESIPAEITKRITYAVRRVPGYLREDAEQEAALAVLVAMARFDPSRGTRSHTFLGYRAAGAVADWWRREDPATRSHRRAIKAGDATGIAFRTTRVLRNHASPEPSPEAQYLRNEAGYRLRSAMCRLSPLRTRVLIGLYFEDRTYKDLAAAMGRSVESIGQSRAQALKQLRRLLK